MIQGCTRRVLLHNHLKQLTSVLFNIYILVFIGYCELFQLKKYQTVIKILMALLFRYLEMLIGVDRKKDKLVYIDIKGN